MDAHEKRQVKNWGWGDEIEERENARRTISEAGKEINKWIMNK